MDDVLNINGGEEVLGWSKAEKGEIAAAWGGRRSGGPGGDEWFWAARFGARQQRQLDMWLECGAVAGSEGEGGEWRLDPRKKVGVAAGAEGEGGGGGRS